MSLFEFVTDNDELEALMKEDLEQSKIGFASVTSGGKGKMKMDDETPAPQSEQGTDVQDDAGGVEIDLDLETVIELPSKISMSTAVEAIGQIKWSKIGYGKLVQDLGVDGYNKFIRFLGALQATNTGKVDVKEADALGAAHFSDVSLLQMVRGREGVVLPIPTVGWQLYLSRMFPDSITIKGDTFLFGEYALGKVADVYISQEGRRTLRSVISKMVDFVELTEESLVYARSLMFFFDFNASTGKWVVTKKPVPGKTDGFNLFYISPKLTASDVFKDACLDAQSLNGKDVEVRTLANYSVSHGVARELTLLKKVSPMAGVIDKYITKMDEVNTKEYNALPPKDAIEKLFAEQVRNRIVRAKIMHIPEMDYTYRTLAFVPRSRRREYIYRQLELTDGTTSGTYHCYELKSGNDPTPTMLKEYFDAIPKGGTVVLYMPMLNYYKRQVMSPFKWFVTDHGFLSMDIICQPQQHSRWVYIALRKDDTCTVKLDTSIANSNVVLKYKSMVDPYFQLMLKGEQAYMRKLITGHYTQSGNLSIDIVGKTKYERIYYDFNPAAKADSEL